MTARLGTQLVFATEFCPEGKGKIERWIQTVQDDFLDEAKHSDAQTLCELNSFFWAWLDKVYHARKHSTTGQSPRDSWQAQADRVRTIPPEHLIDVFLWEEERTVDKSGTFQMGGNRYPVSEHLVREKVQVRFDPFDLTRVRVYHNGLFVEVASPEKLTTRTHHKADPHRPKRAASLDSSRAFRAQLSEAYQNQVAETLVGLPKNLDGSGFLSQADFFELLKSGLSRHELRTHEKNEAFNFFQHTAPVPKAVAEKALSTMVAEKGTRLHLRAYFRKIHDAVAAAKGGQ